MACVAWPLLIIAGLLEVAWALLLKESDGFSRFWPSIGFLVFAAGSIVLLTLALRDLPVGTAYAAWTGIGAVGTALFGLVLFSESASPARLASILLIVVGVAGTYLFGD